MGESLEEMEKGNGPRMEKILSVDPGETVGWVWLEKSSGNLIWGQAEDPWHWLKEFQVLVNDLDRVLIENYVIRPGQEGANFNRELLTVKVIGVVEWLCKESGVKYEFLPPGIGNQFFIRERLEDMDLWWPGVPHARSALRQLLYWLRFVENE